MTDEVYRYGNRRRPESRACMPPGAASRTTVPGRSRDIVVLRGERANRRSFALGAAPRDTRTMVAELGGMRSCPPSSRGSRSCSRSSTRGARRGEDRGVRLPRRQAENIAYLRGDYLRLSDFCPQARAGAVLAGLPRAWDAGRRASSSMPLSRSCRDHRRGPDRGARRLLAQDASFDGEKLYLQGFWNILMRVISGEA